LTVEHLRCWYSKIPLAMRQERLMSSGTPAAGSGSIDCDVHNAVDDIAELFPYLPQRWSDYCVAVEAGDPVQAETLTHQHVVHAASALELDRGDVPTPTPGTPR
jgi:hypothetical protein